MTNRLHKSSCDIRPFLFCCELNCKTVNIPMTTSSSQRRVQYPDLQSAGVFSPLLARGLYFIHWTTHTLRCSRSPLDILFYRNQLIFSHHDQWNPPPPINWPWCIALKGNNVNSTKSNSMVLIHLNPDICYSAFKVFTCEQALLQFTTYLELGCSIELDTDWCFICFWI